MPLLLQTPPDQLVPDGGVLTVLKNLYDAAVADLTGGHRENSSGINEEQKLLHQLRRTPELFLRTTLVTGVLHGHPV